MSSEASCRRIIAFKASADVSCHGQVVIPASRDITAILKVTNTMMYSYLLKTGPDICGKWKTRIASLEERLALKVASCVLCGCASNVACVYDDNTIYLSIP